MDKVNGIDPIQNCHIAEEASWEIRNGGRATRNWNIQREGESERERRADVEIRIWTKAQMFGIVGASQ